MGRGRHIPYSVTFLFLCHRNSESALSAHTPQGGINSIQKWRNRKRINKCSSWSWTANQLKAINADKFNASSRCPIRTAPVDVWCLNFLCLSFRSRGCGLADCRLSQLTAIWCYSMLTERKIVPSQPENEWTIIFVSRTCLLHLI